MDRNSLPAFRLLGVWDDRHSYYLTARHWARALEKNRAVAIACGGEEAYRKFQVYLHGTADVYGAGVSEQIIGRFLKSCRTPIRIATKYGRGEGIYPDNYSKDNLRISIEGSLSRLGVKALDLLQLHCIPTEVLKQGEIFTWLQDLKKEGLIKHYGASVETIEQGLLCLEHEGLASLQVIYNIFRQKPAESLFTAAEDNGVGIIVRLPLARGLLTGKFSSESRFAKSDHRNYNKDGKAFSVGETFSGLPFKKGLEFAEAIKNLLPENMTMTQLALRWILDNDCVSVVIPGASSPKQVEANVGCSRLPAIPRDLHQLLEELYKEKIEKEIRGSY